MDDTRGVLDDEPRETIIDRIREFAESMREAAKRFSENVREYFSGEQGFTSASKDLQEASGELERTDESLRKILQHEQEEQEIERSLSRETGGRGM